MIAQYMLGFAMRISLLLFTHTWWVGGGRRKMVLFSSFNKPVFFYFGGHVGGERKIQSPVTRKESQGRAWSHLLRVMTIDNR